MGTITDLANDVYADGPGSQPLQPDKSRIRSLFFVIDQNVTASTEGLVQAATWSDLSSIAGTREGQPGRVAGPDIGTHTDPVVGGTVANEGEYVWSSSPAGWQRVGDLLVARADQIAASFVDELGFVGARLATDGTMEQNLPSRSYELLDTDQEAEFLSVSDARGFKILSLQSDRFDVTGGLSGSGEDFNDDFDASPLIGGTLAAFYGDETRIYARNILNQRSDLSRVRASVYSEAATDGSRLTYGRLGDDELIIDLGRCGSTIRLQTRLDEVNSDVRHEATIGAVTAPVSPGSGDAATVLMIGDSITNRQMAAWLDVIATNRGYNLTFVGTINGAGIGQISTDATGPLGEAREGWESGDFTYSVTDRVSIIAAGDEATYLASDKNTKWEQNPFLNPSTETFDFADYLDRFGVTAPDVVFLEVGTNDIRDRALSELEPNFSDNLAAICGSILSAQPTTKIVLWFPPVSRSSDRDAQWAAYVVILSALIRFVRSEANPNIHLVPTWAMASQEVGFPLAAGTISDLGVQTAGLSDTVHMAPYNIASVAEILAAAAAAVAQGTL